MVYALWDTETNNLVAEYGDIEQALALVLRGIERNGRRDTDTLLLQAEDERGEVRLIAAGPHLVELAQSGPHSDMSPAESTR